MFVVAVGTAFPDFALSDRDLSDLGVHLDSQEREFLERSGVRSRAVSIPLEHVRQTGNGDLFEAWKVACASPTSLGVAAAKVALERAGIGIESVGLVLADTATPYQTCPSEAQRIAGEFSVKIPAYDVVGGVGAIASYLSMLAAWKPERLPEYVLCVSTNTPSQQVRYRENRVCAALLGDAAFAFILSPRVTRGARVLRAECVADREYRMPVVVAEQAVYNPMHVLTPDKLKQQLCLEMDELRSFDSALLRKATFIPPQLYASEAVHILSEYEVDSPRVLTTVRDRGFSLGSSGGVALASAWDNLGAGSPVVLLHCGDGLRGSVVIEKQ